MDIGLFYGINAYWLDSILIGFPKQEESSQLVQSMTIKQIYKQFIIFMPTCPSNKIKLKLLFTFHVLMDDSKYGKMFVAQFSYWNGWKNNQEQIK